MPAELARQLWDGRVAGGVLRDDRAAADQRGGTEAERQGHDKEGADEPHRPVHGRAGGARVRDGEDTAHDVREPGGTEGQREREAEKVELAGQRLTGAARDVSPEPQAGAQERVTAAA